MNKRFLHVLWLIPILMLGYIAWVNLWPLGGMITYRIDVGTEDLKGVAVISGPFDRISDSDMMPNGISYRELQKSGVYFQLKSFKIASADEIRVRVRFYNAFPNEARLILGAKDKQEWNYSWIVIYDSSYEQWSDLPAIVEFDGGWIISEAKWRREDLYLAHDTLQFVFDVPHLVPTGNLEKTIPIDWIEISLEIPPIWERL